MIPDQPAVRSAKLALLFLGATAFAFAQTDEIQVYDAGLSPKGTLNLTVHTNFTPRGAKDPAFPGAVISNHAFVSVAEWAYGVTSWFEQGLYFPLVSHSPGGGFQYNAIKIRELFAVPNADERTFVYGVNFEFSFNQKQWNDRHYTSEIRPIIGWHIRPPEGASWKPIDLIVNPILDTQWRGGFKRLNFVPATRLAYNLSERWQIAAEEYSDYGEFRDVPRFDGQFHQIWAVFNHKSERTFNIEAGIGFGVTSASDKLTLKLMFERDIRHARKPASSGIASTIRRAFAQ